MSKKIRFSHEYALWSMLVIEDMREAQGTRCVGGTPEET